MTTFTHTNSNPDICDFFRPLPRLRLQKKVQSEDNVHHKQIITYPKSFKDSYKVTKKVLGRGSTGIVKECINRTTNKKYAVKIVKKTALTQLDIDTVRNEIRVLKLLKKQMKHNKHENQYIINLVDTYENNRYLYLILELCSGNDLTTWISSNFDKSRSKYNVDEKEVAYIFYQIIVGIHICHKNGVVHRDIKPDNLLFIDSNHLEIKLSDFGLSFNKEIKNNKKMNTKCGTPHYVSPELLLNKQYDSKCDWWSAGVLLHVLLSGTYPFYSSTGSIQRIYQRIVSNNWCFANTNHWPYISNLTQKNVTHIKKY